MLGWVSTTTEQKKMRVGSGGGKKHNFWEARIIDLFERFSVSFLVSSIYLSRAIDLEGLFVMALD